MTKLSSIKPCYFCDSLDTQLVEFNSSDNDEGITTATVVCIDCEARGPLSYLQDSLTYKQKAIDMYNAQNTDADKEVPTVKQVVTEDQQFNDEIYLRLQFTDGTIKRVNVRIDKNTITYTNKFIGLTYGESLSLIYKIETHSFASHKRT